MLVTIATLISPDSRSGGEERLAAGLFWRVSPRQDALKR